jgi:hypothetical protein
MNLLRLARKLNLDEVVEDVIHRLKLHSLDLYFVVEHFQDSEDYEWVGLAYSREAAKEIRGRRKNMKILKLDVGKLLTLAEKAGGVEDVS